MARASAVLGGTFKDAEQLGVFLSIGNSSEFCDHNGQLLSVHATPAKEIGILVPRVLYQVQYSAFKVHYLHAAEHHRRSTAQGLIFELERHRACPSINTSADEPSDVPSHAHTLRGTTLSI